MLRIQWISNDADLIYTKMEPKVADNTIMSNEDTDIDSMITTFNTAVTETATEILGKHRQKKKNLGHYRNY